MWAVLYLIYINDILLNLIGVLTTILGADKLL